MSTAERRPLLIIKTGSADPAVRCVHGDFERWITAGLAPPPSLAVEVCDVGAGAEPPVPAELSAAIVTGSSAMVTWHEAWMEHTAGWLAEAAGCGLPVLGICFGHQLLAHALGGRVGPNPRGREVGTVALELTRSAAADPLLQGLPSPSPVQTTHVESVLELPTGATHLGATAGDPHHAFRWGAAAWGVQFHPEFTPEVMSAYLRSRRTDLDAEGLDVDRLIASVRPSSAGAQVLRRFAAIAAARLTSGHLPLAAAAGAAQG